MSAQVDSVSSWDKRGTDEQKEESFWWVLTSEGGTPAQTHNNPVILINIAFLSFLFLFSVPASCKLCRSLTISSFLLLLLLLSFHAGSSLMDHGPLGPSTSPGSCWLTYWCSWISSHPGLRWISFTISNTSSLWSSLLSRSLSCVIRPAQSSPGSTH